MPEPLGLYVHIPFCKSKCDYCDFYSIKVDEDLTAQYKTALLTHISETAPLVKAHQVDTVYFGGGTPLMLGPDNLCGLLKAIRKKFHLSKNAEITLEANPDSVDLKSLKTVRRAGFNRLSLGMQSALDSELAAVHRPHTFAQTQEAVALARKAGFQNLSLDLIYGLPGQTLESWKTSLDAALALEPDHLSCYGLKVEPSTPLAARVAAGEPLPDDDLQADCYLYAVQKLEEAGYHQYEISNFAKPGLESRHNLKYWTMKPYLGLGPAAHSDFGGRRYSFIRDLQGYISALKNGGQLLDEDMEIPHRERGAEYLMLRLRTSQGVEEWEYRREFFMDFSPIEALLTKFEHQGWALREKGRWRFTPEGFLRSNQLIGALLEAQEKATFQSTLNALRAKPGGT